MAITVDTRARLIRADNFEFQYSADDLINAADCDHYGRAWMFHDAGMVLAVVFSEYPAYCYQDAIDEAVDRGKLDRFKISQDESKDYSAEDDRVSYLGNFGVPMDIEGLDCIELPAGPFRHDEAVRNAKYALSLQRVTPHAVYDVMEGAAI